MNPSFSVFDDDTRFQKASSLLLLADRHKQAQATTVCMCARRASDFGRRLMVEKVACLGPGTSLEVAVYSALEWRPEEE